MRTPAERRRRAASCLIDSLLLFSLAAALVWPLLTRTTYLDNWGSIDSAFIGDARFLAENWPHPLWYPLWYGGTRFDYVYPPALRYGTAGLSLLLGAPTARAYHLYTAFFYAIGIAGVYVFVRALVGSRFAASLAAIATATLSPAYFLVDWLRGDAERHFYAPQRLIALLRWGEGPHTCALAVVPIALAASYWAMKRKSLPAAAVAAILSAIVVSNNFYGGVTLTILFSLLVWSLWVTGRDNAVWLWAAGIGALGYSLTAFWLVPSYLRITRANLFVVQAGGEASHLAVAAAPAAAYLALTWRWAAGRDERLFPVFAAGALGAFGAIVLGEEWFGLKLFGTPGRFVPELDLALILFAVQLGRWLWAWMNERFPGQRWPPRIVFALLGAILLASSLRYVGNAWRIYPETTNYRQRVEYRLSEWMATNLPGVRAHVDGSVRFWYNAWHSLAYLGGGADQGMVNQAVLAPLWNLRVGESGETSVDWLRCFGVDAVIVNDETSQEIYHGDRHPKKFEGLLPLLHNNGQGDAIYRVPRKRPGLAQPVFRSAVKRLEAIRGGWDVDNIAAYAALIEEGPDSPVRFAWQGTDAMLVEAALQEGEMLLLQVAYDPAWRAYIDDRRLKIRKDSLGQMLVEAPAGPQQIRIVFELPLENRIGRWLTLIGGMVAVGLLGSGLRRKRRPVPGLGA